jgi:hypothetical protein
MEAVYLLGAALMFVAMLAMVVGCEKLAGRP